jgi:hypothetical protein
VARYHLDGAARFGACDGAWRALPPACTRRAATGMPRGGSGLFVGASQKKWGRNSCGPVLCIALDFGLLEAQLRVNVWSILWELPAPSRSEGALPAGSRLTHHRHE